MKTILLNIKEAGLQNLDSSEMNQITGGDTAYTVGYVIGWTIGYTFGGIVSAVKVVTHLV